MPNLLSIILKEDGVRHTYTHVDRLYNEHPYRDTMFGIVDMLRDYGIESIGIKANTKDIGLLSVPSVIDVSNESDSKQVGFAVVTDITDKELKYTFDGRSTHKIPISAIGEIWTGKAIVIKDDEFAIESDYSKNFWLDVARRVERLILFIAPFVGLLLGSYIQRYNISTYSFISILISMLGCLPCLLLLQKERENGSLLADRICSIFGTNHCGQAKAVLFPIFDYFPLEVIGLGYFLSRVIYSIFAPWDMFSFAVVDVVAFIASLWCIGILLWKKHYCILCIWAQVMILGLCFWDCHVMSIEIGVYSLINVILYLSLLSVVICLLNKLRLLGQTYDELNNSIRTKKLLKADPELFAYKLMKSKRCAYNIDKDAIVYGNRDAKTQITIFTNPYCEACSNAHGQVEKLIHRIGRKVRVQYVLNPFMQEQEKACRLLIAAYKQLDQFDARQIFNKWFADKNKNIDDYLKNYSIDIYSEDVERIMKAHGKNVIENGINATPSIFVNGYSLPVQYELNDLITLLSN